MKSKPNFIVDPNLPDRGVKVDRSWLRDSMTAAEFQKVQADTKDDPKAQQFSGIQCRNLARLNKEGIKVSLGSDGGIPWAAHEEMADMAGCGMTPRHTTRLHVSGFQSDLLATRWKQLVQ